MIVKLRHKDKMTDVSTQENSNINNDELKNVLHIIESKTFKFIFYFILSGIVVIFFASITSPPEEAKIYQHLASAANTFVSIVVGIVAMVMSIISLFFSFYNTKQSYDTHDDYLVKFTNITNSLNQTIRAQEENIQQMREISKELVRLDSNITARIEKISDKLEAMENFKQLQPTESPWGKKDDWPTDDK